MGENQHVLERKARLYRASAAYLKFMEELGLPLNEETKGTPDRVARMFLDDFTSHDAAPPKVALFNRKNYDQYVVIRDVEFSSICEHHHLPFSGVFHFGYHPQQWLAGLSKVPRVVKHFASRPQLQEHLTVEIAEYLFHQLKPFGVMVVGRATHSCMACRGVRSILSQTVTSKIITRPKVRMDKVELLKLMGV